MNVLGNRVMACMAAGGDYRHGMVFTEILLKFTKILS